MNLILTKIKLVKLNYSSTILDIINISSFISARNMKYKIWKEYCNYDIEMIKRHKLIGSLICNYNRIGLLEDLSEDDINSVSAKPCLIFHPRVRLFTF